MVEDTTVKTEIGGFAYEVVPGGVLGGQSTVILALGDRDEGSQPNLADGKGIYAGKQQGPRALLKIWDKYGWKRRLTSGDCPLLVTGPESLTEEHVEYIDSLATALRTAHIYVESTVENIDSSYEELPLEQVILRYEPDDAVFTELPPETQSKLLDFGNLSRRGKATFEFVVQHKNDIERISEIKRACGIPNEALYLVPTGKDEKSHEKSVGLCKKAVKKNIWRYSHRYYTE